MTKKPSIQKLKKTKLSTTTKGDLLDELREMIEKTREYVASVVNSRLTLLYWHIGERIQHEILRGERAEYGKSIISSLSHQLTLEYGNGFNSTNLHRMVNFSETFPDKQIVASLTQQLSWTHFVMLIPIQDSLKHDFYAELCRIEKWNVRTLRKKIDTMLYERTAISKKPELVVRAELDSLRKEDRLTPDLVFRDPYVLEFLNLNDRYLEKDLEDAIMRELEQFLLELGVGFCFSRVRKILQLTTRIFALIYSSFTGT
jgi:predicted nuclease of restriction endonuclease-like (RecB) superfamily